MAEKTLTEVQVEPKIVEGENTIKVDFFANSNLYFGNADHLKLKLTDHEVIKKDMKPEEFLLLVGDLRDNCIIKPKRDALKITDRLFSAFWSSLNPIDSEKQWAEFYSRWIQPYEQGKDHDFTEKVKLCLGNMDVILENKKFYTVRDFVKDNYGGSCYSFNKGGVNFVCMSTGPNAEVIKIFKAMKLSKEEPLIVFWHFGFETLEPLWSKKNKQAILEVLKDYNVVCIINGDDHASYVRNINYISNRSIVKFKTICVGGDEYAKITYQKEGEKNILTVNLVDDNNNNPTVKFTIKAETKDIFVINSRNKVQNKYLQDEITI